MSTMPSVACHPREAGQSLRFSVFIGSNEWRRPGSNRQPPACKAGALPVELRPPWAVMSSGWRPDRGRRSPERTASPQPAPVGTRGFEPRTSALSELRSNQLSYAPVQTGAGILAHPRAAVQPSTSATNSLSRPERSPPTRTPCRPVAAQVPDKFATELTDKFMASLSLMAEMVVD